MGRVGYLAAIGALIVGIAAMAGRTPRTVVRERRVVRVEVPVEVPVRVESPRPGVPAVERLAATKPAGGSPVAPAYERMLFLFDRELDLTDEQYRHVRTLLTDRQAEIEAYHKEIRAQGLFNPKEYIRRIREVQATSYGRMAEVLDSAQHARFMRLLSQGQLGDAVAFTLDAGMTVIR